MNKSMSRLDELTQRNASAAEEVASTSEELASQAESLQHLIAFFRLGGNDEMPGGGQAADVPRLRPVPASRPLVTAAALARHAVAAGNDPEFTRF
jgi:methyl-accepting chemotaxis protein